MIKSQKILPIITITLVLLFISCKKKNSITGPITDPEMRFTYVTYGDKIIYDQSGSTYTYSYCVGDSLYTEIDTVESDGLDTIRYVKNGNELRLYVEQDTMPASGAVVEFYLLLSGSGTGVGIQGLWTAIQYGYEVSNGSLTPDELEEVEQNIAETGEFLSEISYQIRITGTEFIFYITELGTRNYAEDFVEEWNDYDSTLYDISATEVNPTTVHLTGRSSGEVVTIVFNSEGDMTFTSSNAEHPPHTYFEEPTSCPNGYRPEWFQQFLGDNPKIILFKSQSRSPKRKNIQLWPLH